MAGAMRVWQNYCSGFGDGNKESLAERARREKLEVPRGVEWFHWERLCGCKPWRTKRTSGTGGLEVDSQGSQRTSRLASIVTARAECPFEGDVSGRIDDWLEANLTGDKAESTARAYAGMWAKWCVWAERQQWDTAYLNPKEDKDPGLPRIPRPA